MAGIRLCGLASQSYKARMWPEEVIPRPARFGWPDCGGAGDGGGLYR